MALEERPLVPRPEGFIDVRVRASYRYISKYVSCAAPKRVLEQPSEQAPTSSLNGDLVGSARGKDRQPFPKDRLRIVDGWKRSQRSRVATIEDHHNLSHAGLVRHGQDLGHPDAFVVTLCVLSHQVAIQIPLSAVSRKVKNRHVGRIAEQIGDLLS